MKTFVPLVQWLGPWNRPMTYRFFCITQKHLLGPHTPETAHRALLNTSSPEYKLKNSRTCSQQLTIESHEWHKSSTSLGQPDLLRLSPTSLSSPGPPKTDTFSSCPKPSFSARPFSSCCSWLFWIQLAVLSSQRSSSPVSGEGKGTPQGNPGPAGAPSPNPHFVSTW